MPRKIVFYSLMTIILAVFVLVVTFRPADARMIECQTLDYFERMIINLHNNHRDLQGTNYAMSVKYYPDRSHTLAVINQNGFGAVWIFHSIGCLYHFTNRYGPASIAEHYFSQPYSEIFPPKPTEIRI